MVTASTAGLLKIIIFLVLGIGLKKGGILKDSDIEGFKKIILKLAIPAVLFLSFSSLDFNMRLIPVIIIVFAINFILFWFGIFLFKITGSKYRILPLILSTMNFALIGIPLYEAIFSIENIYHYTTLGIGNEIYVWFVFYFMFRWFLTKGKNSSTRINNGFLKSPIVWGIMLGCAFSIFNVNISSSDSVLVQGLYDTLIAASKLTTPLVLIFIGYKFSIKLTHLKQSLIYVLLRLLSACSIGYFLKWAFLDSLVESSIYYNAAFFLLITLPPMFTLPILAAEYLEEDETAVLNNAIVLHSIITIVLFAIYSIIFIL